MQDEGPLFGIAVLLGGVAIGECESVIGLYGVGALRIIGDDALEGGFGFGDERGIVGTGVVVAEPDEVERVIGIFTGRIAIDDGLILHGGFGEAFLGAQ